MTPDDFRLPRQGCVRNSGIQNTISYRASKSLRRANLKFLKCKLQDSGR